MYIIIVNAGWVALFIFWLTSALSTKRAARGPRWGVEIGIRLAIAIVVIALIRVLRGRHLLYKGALIGMTFGNPVVHAAGLVVFFAGVALAVWARIFLGRNWGVPMSLRQDHELVVTGPYRFVRHPIYSAFLLAIIGSILAGEFWWPAPLPVVLVYFLYSGFTEEKMMAQTFPSAYPEYKKRTKMLIPFVV